MEVAVMVVVDMEEVVEDTAEVAVDMEVEDIKQSIPSTAVKHITILYFSKVTNPHLITILERVIKLSSPSLYYCLRFQKFVYFKNCPNCFKLTMKLSDIVDGVWILLILNCKETNNAKLKLKPGLSNLLPNIHDL